MNIKKKLLAITLVCAIASSFAACSDKTNQNGSGSQGKVKADVQANSVIRKTGSYYYTV